MRVGKKIEIGKKIFQIMETHKETEHGDRKENFGLGKIIFRPGKSFKRLRKKFSDLGNKFEIAEKSVEIRENIFNFEEINLRLGKKSWRKWENF